MNNKLSITYLITIIALLFFSCGARAKEENKNNAPVNSISLHAGDENYFKIDTKETVVTWKGSSVQGAHTGYVYLSKGELMIENGKLTGGTVEVNMRTIQDENHRSDNNLISHLMDADFFDVQKFPTSSITITKVESINAGQIKITGNLTIKGITHPVTFPAGIEIKDGIVKANAKLVIDRTLWDVRYKSGKFFDNLKDEAISDSIEFNIKLVAKK
jgi:polyisoprenoid-binding protein YceI